MTIFDCSFMMLTQFVPFIVPIIGISLLFEFTGSLLFGTK